MLRRVVVLVASTVLLTSAAMAGGTSSSGSGGATPGGGDKTDVKRDEQGPTQAVGSQVPAEQKAGAADAATQEGDKTKVTPGQAPTKSTGAAMPESK